MELSESGTLVLDMAIHVRENREINYNLVFSFNTKINFSLAEVLNVLIFT